jgi:hypothetical protein
MSKELSISVCTYKDGTFEVILKDSVTLEEVTLSGKQDVSDDELDFLNGRAPACVFTRYIRL